MSNHSEKRVKMSNCDQSGWSKDGLWSESIAFQIYPVCFEVHLNADRPQIASYYPFSRSVVTLHNLSLMRMGYAPALSAGDSLVLIRASRSAMAHYPWFGFPSASAKASQRVLTIRVWILSGGGVYFLFEKSPVFTGLQGEIEHPFLRQLTVINCRLWAAGAHPASTYFYTAFYFFDFYFIRGDTIAPIYRIHEEAVDTGITDLAAEHDQYLYGNDLE